MGLDILLCAVNEAEYETCSLSRTFCTLMCHYSGGDENSELRQVASITGVDTSPLLMMEQYMLDSELEQELEFSDETESATVMRRFIEGRASVAGNINFISGIIQSLIDRLSTIKNLPDLLTPSWPQDYLNNKLYFSDLLITLPSGRVRDNFKQDLQLFRSFLIDAKSIGSSTVFFNYG